MGQPLSLSHGTLGLSLKFRTSGTAGTFGTPWDTN